MRHVHALTGALLLVSATAANARGAAAAQCAPGTRSSRIIVRQFYQLALVDRQPGVAFRRYMSADFLDHKADLAQPTREGIAAYLQDVIKTLPGARWEILRIVADGDMVSLHARFTPEPKATPYAIADFFRLRNCKIVEHWDVVAPPPKVQRNPNSRF